MPDYFVTPPGWSWDIVLYFFFGGLAGGLFFIACMLRLVNPDRARPLSRIGFYLSFPLINVCAILLIHDLGVPERFWHMMFQSEQFPELMFKWWSPISFGTWIVAASGTLPLLSFLHAFLEGGVVRSPGLRRFTQPFHDGDSWLGRVYLVLGAIWGLMIGGYTGMLIMVSNAPTWSADPFLPPMFMASAVATGAAAIYLLARVTGAGTPAGRVAVVRTAALAVTFELVLLIAAVLHAIGGVSPFFLGWWGAFFWLVVLPVGFLAPIALLVAALYRGRQLVPDALLIGSALVLVGGLLVRVLEVFGGQAYYVPY